MKTIRMGNDIQLTWYIIRNNENEDFSGKTVSVYLYDKYGNTQPFEWDITDNVIHGTFRGKDQKVNGVYRLTLIENEGLHNMVTLDYVDCFLLSKVLKDATSSGRDSTPNLTSETIEIESLINTNDGVDGANAYQVAVDNGFSGTVQDWLDSLKGEKGDKGDTGTPDTSQFYDKTEIGNILASYMLGSDMNDFASEVAAKFNTKLDASAYTPTDLSNYYNKNQVDNKLSGKVGTDQLTNFITLTDIQELTTTVNNKLDSSAYTPTDLSGYYTKEQTNSAISQSVSSLSDSIDTKLSSYMLGSDMNDFASEVNTKFGNKLDISAFTAYSGTVNTSINNKLNTATFEAYSGTVSTSMGNKLDTSTFTAYSGSIDTVLESKLDSSAYTPTDLSNYYNKSQVDAIIDDNKIIGTYTGTYLASGITTDYKYSGQWTDYTNFVGTYVRGLSQSSGLCEIGDTLIVDVNGYKEIVRVGSDYHNHSEGYKVHELSYSYNSSFDAYEFGVYYSSELDNSGYPTITIFKIDDNGSDTNYITVEDKTNYYSKTEIDGMLSKPDWEDVNGIINKPFGTYRANLKYTSENANNANISFFHISSNVLNNGKYFTYKVCLNPCELSVGKTYFVYVNGVCYGSLTPKTDNGNMWISTNYNSNTYEPYLDYDGGSNIFGWGRDYGDGSGFCYLGIIYDTNNFIYAANGRSVYPSIKIYEANNSGSASVVTHIESKYIDLESVVHDRANNNKPFGDIIETTINGDTIYDNTLSFTQTGPTHGGGNLELTSGFSVGDMVTLYMDGVNLGTGTAITNSNASNRLEVSQGDRVSGTFTDNWLIYYSNNAYTLCVNGTTSGSHTIKVEKGNTVITSNAEKKLATKYVNYDIVEDKTVVDKPFGTYATSAISSTTEYIPFIEIAESAIKLGANYESFNRFTYSSGLSFLEDVVRDAVYYFYLDDTFICSATCSVNQSQVTGHINIIGSNSNDMYLYNYGTGVKPYLYVRKTLGTSFSKAYVKRYKYTETPYWIDHVIKIDSKYLDIDSLISRIEALEAQINEWKNNGISAGDYS